MHGLLVVSLDANEQFCSDHRCCQDCLSREVTRKDAQALALTTIDPPVLTRSDPPR